MYIKTDYIRIELADTEEVNEFNAQDEDIVAITIDTESQLIIIQKAEEKYQATIYPLSRVVIMDLGKVQYDKKPTPPTPINISGGQADNSHHIISLMSHTLGSIGQMVKEQSPVSGNFQADTVVGEIQRIYNGYVQAIKHLTKQ